MRPSLHLVLLPLLALAAPARAARCDAASAEVRCSCRHGIPLSVHRNHASTIVLATVVADSARALASHGGGHQYPGHVVTVVVGARWKGPAADTLRIHTGEGGGDCGYRFRVGATYLVFATGTADQLWTGICQPTRRAEDVSDELRDALVRAEWNGYPLTHPFHRW